MFNGQGFLKALASTDTTTRSATHLCLRTTWSGLSLLSQLLCSTAPMQDEEPIHVVMWCCMQQDTESSPELCLLGFDGTGPLPRDGFQWGLPFFAEGEPSEAVMMGFFATGSPPTRPREANWIISLNARLAELPREVMFFCLHTLFTFATLTYLDNEEQLVPDAQLPPSSIHLEDLPIVLEFLRREPRDVPLLQRQPRSTKTQAFFTWCADQIEKSHQKSTLKT